MQLSPSEQNAPLLPNTESLYLQYLAHLIDFSQQWYDGATTGFGHLAQEVQTMTHGHARLSSRADTTPPVQYQRDAWHTNLICWAEQVYGSLHVVLIPQHPAYPVVPIAVAQRLASLCGWLLHVRDGRNARHSLTQGGALRQIHHLTEQQRIIVQYLLSDLTPRAIAQQMGIEVSTVKRHLANLYERLGVHSRAEVCHIALSAGDDLPALP